MDLRSYEEIKQHEARRAQVKGWRSLLAAAEENKFAIAAALVAAVALGCTLYQQGVFAAAATQLQSATAAAGRLWTLAADLVRYEQVVYNWWPDGLNLTVPCCCCCCLRLPGAPYPLSPVVAPFSNCRCPLLPAACLQPPALAAHPRQREGAAGDHLAAAGVSNHGAPGLQDPGGVARAGLPGA